MLYIGIVVSMLLRGVFIAAGAAAISAASWVFYIFGAFLIYTAVRLALEGENDEEDFQENALLRGLRRVLPMTPDYSGPQLATRVNGKRMLTPLVIVIAAISVANVVFALDSIPAIFGLTQDPYIVLTANAFALMGLRQLYFLIGGLLERIIYLNVGLSVILGFIGVKLVIEALHGSHIDHLGAIPLPEIGIATSLLFILATLTITVAASLAKSGWTPAARCRAQPPLGARAAALRQGGDRGVVGGVDQLTHLVVGHRTGPVDGVPAVPADVVAHRDRLRVPVPPLGGLGGVPPALHADRARAR